jgi:hypothetical protein
MKRISLLLLALLAPVSHLAAQVTVEVLLPPDQMQFLAGESLPVSVSIKNRSGQTLHLGNAPDWVTFSVESKEGFVVVKSGDAPVPGSIDLESSKVATTPCVDLAPYFILPRQGRYSITATLHIKDWSDQITSQPKSFEVIEGAKIWSQEFGVPNSGLSSNSPPEARKFTLEQANYLSSRLRLYMRLTDLSGTKVFKVTAIGPMVSFGRPDAQMDKASNLHVMYQNGARTFHYVVFNPNGEMVTRQNYEYLGGKPRLATDETGKIGIEGGQRRPSASDLPPPQPE